jgi:hypothetical protein
MKKTCASYHFLTLSNYRSRPFRHRGCRCPREFYGDHCEFLKFPGEFFDEDQLEIPFNTSAVRSPATAIMMTLMTLALVMLGALIRRKLKAPRVPREITIESADVPTHGAFSWGNRYSYSDSRYNGRHRSYNSHNLHVATVFGDTDIA